MIKFKRVIKPAMLPVAALLTAILAGCGSDGGGGGIAGAGTPVDLGSAENFVILSKTGITNIPTSDISGNIGSSPITAADMNTVTCTEVTGTIYGADDAYEPIDRTCFAGSATDITLVANAILDMGIAYRDAAGRTTPDYEEELYAGDISNKTLYPGLYKWSTGVLINTSVTLSGSASDIWIFQIAGDLTQAAATSVILIGGAQAKNIFWQVGGGTGVALDTTAHFEGVILAAKGITVKTGATVNGRLLADTAVILDKNVVIQPAP